MSTNRDILLKRIRKLKSDEKYGVNDHGVNKPEAEHTVKTD